MSTLGNSLARIFEADFPPDAPKFMKIELLMFNRIINVRSPYAS